MPTSRLRHTVTESEQLAAALDPAAKRWPQHAESRSRLLVRLALAGGETLEGDARAARKRDCFLLAAALQAGAERVLTFDIGLVRQARRAGLTPAGT